MALVSILQGLAELILNKISATSSAAILPVFGVGIIIFSYYLGILTLKIVGTFERFLRWSFCSYCFPIVIYPNRISCVLQMQLLSGTTAEHLTSRVLPYFNLSLKDSSILVPYPSSS
jgi:hypothetical protein